MDDPIEMEYESKGKTYILSYFPEKEGSPAYAHAYEAGSAPSVGTTGSSGEWVAGVDLAEDESLEEVFDKLKKAIDEL